jgi:hypothetical protein
VGATMTLDEIVALIEASAREIRQTMPAVSAPREP